MTLPQALVACAVIGAVTAMVCLGHEDALFGLGLLFLVFL
jgi:hypothetical protein